MKIFVGGSRKLHRLSKRAKAKLLEYMVQGEELFVGASDGISDVMQDMFSRHDYEKVTVCITQGEVYKNRDGWPVCTIDSSSYDVEEFMDTMDGAFIIWDQSCEITYLTLLEFVARGKPVNVLLEHGEDIYTIESMEEVRNILPPASKDWLPLGETLPEQIYRDILNDFMPSEEMKKYLEEHPVARENVLQMILGAPASIAKKEKVCRELSKTDDLFHEILNECIRETQEDYHSYVPYMCRQIKKNLFSVHREAFARALDSLKLKPGERFCIYPARYVYDEYGLWEEKTYRGVPLVSLDEAMAFVRQRHGDCKDEWMVLEKWRPGADGDMEKTYIYYMIGEEIVGFEDLEEILWDGKKRLRDRCVGSDYNLDLPIPYHIGEFVTLDCRPYAPLRTGLLLTGSHILYKDEKDRWRTCSCTRGHRYGDYNFGRSPLYRIAGFEGELNPEERLLYIVQKYLDGNGERGVRMWNEESLWDHDYPVELGNVRDADLLKYMANQGFKLSEKEKAILDKKKVLMKYKKEHEILFSDLEGRWKYAPEETEMAVSYTFDESIWCVLRTTDKRDGAVVGWWKGINSPCHFTGGKGCVDIQITDEGDVFVLCEVESPTMPKHLELYCIPRGNKTASGYLGNRMHCVSPCKVDDISGAHLCLKGDDLCVEIGNKTYPYLKGLPVIWPYREPAKGYEWIDELLKYPEAERPEREKLRNWLV